MESILLPLAVFAAMSAAFFVTGKKRVPLCYIQVEDEDIKIAGESFSSGSRQEDSSEIAARQFLEQKQSGNIDKARALGERYVQVLLDEVPELFGAAAQPQPLLLHHQMLLYSYALNRVVAEHSPNSLVAQTVLNVFYDELESSSPAIYHHVSDMAAFSLYILCERSERRSDDEIGNVYATLCGEADNAQRSEEGNRLYRLYSAYCKKLHDEAAFRM
jgi:hypothetical protein